MLVKIILVLLLCGAFGASPAGPWHNPEYGYYPSSGLGIVLIVLLVLLLMGRL